MPPTPASILHSHLETTLQLLISLSPIMTNDDLLRVRVRLTEAGIVLGQIVIEREATQNSDLNLAPAERAASGDTQTPGPVHHILANHTATNQPIVSRGRTQPSFAENRTPQRVVRYHPTIRTTAHPVTPSSLQRARTRPTAIIDINTDDDLSS